MQAVYHSNDYTTVNFRPDEDIPAGSVVVFDDTLRIAHLDIAAGELGAFASGGGLYRVQVSDGAGDIANGAKVYWSEGEGGGISGAGTMLFGFAAEELVTGTSPPTSLLCHHAPYAGV